MDQPESAILADCRNGRLDRFAELYDFYAEPIYRFVYYKTNHRETAEDLTSLVWLKVLEKIATFRGGSFQAWLYRIARNTVIDHYRTKKAEVPVEDAWDFPSGEQLARDAENRDLLERVRKDLERFPSEQRDILILRLWEDRPYAEIAEIVGKTEGNCKVIVSRVLGKLRLETTVALLLFSSLLIDSSSTV